MPEHAEPRRLRLRADDRQLGAGQPVEQRRLAGVRRTDDRRRSRTGTRRSSRRSRASRSAAATRSAARLLPAVPVPVAPAAGDAASQNRRVRRPRARGHLIVRQRQPAAPCSHSCSAVLASFGGSACALIAGRPGAPHERARRVQPAIEKQRPDRRPPCASASTVASLCTPAWASLGDTAAPPAARSPRRSSASTGATPDARAGGPSSPSCSSREALDQPFRDQQTQHPVADELQPLVGAGCRRRALPLAACLRRRTMGQRLAEQPGRGEGVAEDRLAPRRSMAGHRRFNVIPCSSRLQRISNGHSQTSHQGAAHRWRRTGTRPARPGFPRGTNPTPLLSCTRLSRELSRLSPMAKTWPSGTRYSGVLFSVAVVRHLQDVVLHAVRQGFAIFACISVGCPSSSAT